MAKYREATVRIGRWDLDWDNPEDYVKCLSELSVTLEEQLADPSMGKKWPMEKLALELGKMARLAKELAESLLEEH